MRDWGTVGVDELARLVVVSPHLDDAVLGAAHLLAHCPGSTVVTVFAGAPASYPEPVTEWDRVGGFRAGDDVVALRREEDAAALAVLDATPHHLDFVDHQYLDGARPATAVDEIADALEAALRALDATAIAVPFGLGNPDHAATHEAALRVRERLPDRCWLLYEDLGYKQIPGLLAWRAAKLFVAGDWPTPTVIPVPRDEARKRAALAGYPSQLRSLGADWNLDAKLAGPEQYWRLASPPEGWAGLIADVTGAGARPGT